MKKIVTTLALTLALITGLTGTASAQRYYPGTQAKVNAAALEIAMKRAALKAHQVQTQVRYQYVVRQHRADFRAQQMAWELQRARLQTAYQAALAAARYQIALAQARRQALSEAQIEALTYQAYLNAYLR